MTQHRPPPAVFNFSTFQDAPGVAAQMRLYGAPQLVDIPQTPIPSPLAPDLTPNTVAGIKRRLVGDGTAIGPRGGKEVWASWKRAWDLWNNHYIEGRVSPVWIREEYERLKKIMGEARDKRRRDEQMDRIRNRHHPRLSRTNTTSTAKATVFSKTQPQAGPGKVYRKTTETRPAGQVIVQKMQSRPKPGSTRVYRRKGDVVQEYGERLVTEIVQVERQVPKIKPSVGSWADAIKATKANLPLPEGDNGPESTETVKETTFEERQVFQFGHYDVFGDKVNPEVMSYEQVNAYFKEHGVLPGLDKTDPKPTDISQRPEMWYPVTEPCLKGERTLKVDETVPVIVFEDKLVDTLENDTGVLFGWFEEDVADMNMDSGEDFTANLGFLPADDGEPAVFYKMAHLVEREDGLGGGFFPMKCLDPYPEPEDDDGDGPDSKWVDVLQNTVWRPRRVGEKTLRIEMDEPFEDVIAENRLEVDGGVDCGRSPYPVLRSVTEYFKSPKNFGDLQGVFRKKKMWDGVTGTIFNMPSKPLECDGTEDDRASRMKVLYGDIFRDERNKHRHDFFPFDIRRVKRCNDKNYPAREFATPVIENNETLVRYPWHSPDCDRQEDLPQDDPWWVTPEQKQKRDTPVRRYPPAVSCKGKNHEDLLPVDDSIWREELEDDDYGRWKYYVTNLHGGTLLINGKEIKKNQIAGPLPEFAVIECPGGQIAFWWGVGGRNHLAGTPGLGHHGGWQSLRSGDPDFAKVALTAGQEWDFKIRERITKEFSGNEWEDDEQWDEWKKAVAAPEPEPKSESAKPARFDHPPTGFGEFDKDLADHNPTILREFDRAGVPTGKDVVQSESFSTDREELRWLHTKAEPLARVIEAAKTNNFIAPTCVSAGFFPGAKRPFNIPEVVAQQQALQVWMARVSDITKEQRKLNDKVKKAKADRAEREKQASIAIGMKRAADSNLQGPLPKRTLQDLVRERREAEEAKKKLVEEQAKKREASKPQPIETLVRVFDAAVRKLWELNLATFEKRKVAALAAGFTFLESPPTLDHEVERYRNRTREEERRTAEKLRQHIAARIAAGSPTAANVSTAPGIDAVYEAWQVDQAKAAAELAKKEAVIKQKAADLKKLNEAAEQRRLRIQKAARYAAEKKKAEEKRKADEAAAAIAKKTPAEIGRERRRENMNKRLAQITADNEAKVVAAKAADKSLLNQQGLTPGSGETPATQKTGSQIGGGGLKPSTQDTGNIGSTGGSTGGQYSEENGYTAETQEFIAQTAAMEANFKEIMRVRRDDLEENIRIRARTANQTIEAFIKDQGFNTQEDYILTKLRETPILPAISSPAPPAGPAERDLIKTLPPPFDPPMSEVMRARLARYRALLRQALFNGLKRRAAFEKKTTLQIVRAMKLFDVAAYLNNTSNSIRLADIYTDVPGPNTFANPPPLPAGATQAQADRRSAELTRVAWQRNVAAGRAAVERVKKERLIQRLLDAENFELAAKTLERNAPRRVDKGKTVLGGKMSRDDRDLRSLDL